MHVVYSVNGVLIKCLLDLLVEVSECARLVKYH